MIDLQPQFKKFYDTIRIDFNNSQLLRDKRDLIITNLTDGLSKALHSNTPKFSYFNQGSYDLATGVEPLEGEDYDIDVGIIFDFTKTDRDPVQVKQVVLDILNAPAKRIVDMHRSCVRVQYHQQGAKHFHIDLAIYAYGTDFWGRQNNTLHIAKGYVGSTSDKRIWEISEPYALKECLKTKFSDNLNRDQFRRTIRYLKRWKDYNSALQNNGKPTGIALTACCYKYFQPQYTLDYGSNTRRYNDLSALVIVTQSIIRSFSWNNKITVELPVKPYNNLFAKMGDNQMSILKNELQSLYTKLTEAAQQNQFTRACMILRSAFGGDFPKS